MQAFLELYQQLDASTRTSEKTAALRGYFQAAPAADAAWAVFFLTGQRLAAPVKTSLLRVWVAELTGWPLWLVEASYERVGDLAETVALLLESAEHSASAGWTKTTLPGPERCSADELVPTPGRTPGDCSGPTAGLAALIEEAVIPLRGLPPDEAFRRVAVAWAAQPLGGRLIYTKLLTGALRVGVSRGLTVVALAEVAGVPRDLIEHRLSGNWQPIADRFAELLEPEGARSDDGAALRRPYPFMLASPLDVRPPPPPPETVATSEAAGRIASAEADQPASDDAASTLTADALAGMLGEPGSWAAEWKWDGIRAQLLRPSEGEVLLWSRGQEALTERFPEVLQAAQSLPAGIVLDGEIVAWRNGRPLPFTALQTRINRQRVSRAVLEAAPCVFIAFDVLQADFRDLRTMPWVARRAALETMLEGRPVADLRGGDFTGGAATGGHPSALWLNPVVPLETWADAADAMATARRRGVEGLMLKQQGSLYEGGRSRGPWWKWKVQPYAIDAVLTQAQAGHGRRAGLSTDFTFSVWDGPQLVPFAKAYSGLTDEEMARLDRWIQRHTTARHGPVRSVEPVHVFELHFEAIAPSTRHQSGLAVRFPRIHRWREDKAPAEADHLTALQALVKRQPLLPTSGASVGSRERAGRAGQSTARRSQEPPQSAAPPSQLELF